MTDLGRISREELLRETKIPLEILETEADIYHDMANEMLREIRRNNASGKNTVFIVPVGPVGQYSIFARYANMEGLDCSKLHIINMDEYLTDDLEWIDISHPLSFRGFMERELYSNLRGVSVIPEENRHFPIPGRERETEELIRSLGGVDIAFGGVGICGHIAFNEALEPGVEMSNEEFAALPTRVLDLTRETRTINSVTACGGYIDGIPKKCITIGMREILASKKIRLYMNRDWQRGIIRRICLGEVSGSAPTSFLQTHPDAKITIGSTVAEAPIGHLR